MPTVTPPNGGPAFPNKDELGNMIIGMSRRMWLSGMALSNPDITRGKSDPAECANLCVAYADAMLERLTQ